MRALLATLPAIWVIPCATVAQTPSRYQYLADAANRIIELSEATATPTPEAIEGAASYACGALARLLDDPSFRSDLDKLTSAPSTLQERSRLKQDLTLFSTSFMSWEKETLLKAGLSERAADMTAWAVAALRDAVDHDVRADHVLGTIGLLHSELCDAAKVVQQTRESTQRRRTLHTWGMRLGGALVIVGNATFAAPSGGFALGSVALGSGVLGWSIGQ